MPDQKKKPVISNLVNLQNTSPPVFLLAKNKLFTLPNLLTFLRFWLALIIFIFLVVCASFTLNTVPFYGSQPYQIHDSNYHAFLIYMWVFAGCFYILCLLTDYFDGYFAKKYNMVSNLGKILDPLADKFTNFICLIVFAVFNIIPYFFIIPLVLRDFYVTFLRGYASSKNIIIKANTFGKAATFFLGLSIIAIFFLLPLYSVNVINLGNGKFFGLTGDVNNPHVNGILVYILLIPFYIAMLLSFYAAFEYSLLYHKNVKMLKI